ncbi:MAG TPA: sigma-70 family RNA polymerase sigma factor [Candidatus Hydrogenedens sp.]|nr:sigma-70 family RNA polymerase sigma factor [Candidatus Hydrogenedens sp.]HOK08558.1 sigma-70 family RNA polymerase sigma factor [Candidatus Hydrogenedens sp.]HOL19046.1 sigma-70 family RNA polymerase sigma factor [Candidatus Hydrogenedens sp.]HPP57772.1 sigma-70 family RNA polymerase sigma factor [Candidatus Hydrogenedens sp.]
MRSLEDWELVALAKQGNNEAFDNLIQRYKNQIYTLCFYLTRDTHNAEDLVQETFIRIYKNINRIDPKAQFKTFIFTIARNLALNQLRNDQRKKNFLVRLFERWNYNHKEKNNSPSSLTYSESKELIDIVQECMLELSPEYKEILLLRETQGLDYESIAEVLGCRIGTVRSRLARARAELRKKIKEKGVLIK